MTRNDIMQLEGCLPMEEMAESLRYRVGDQVTFSLPEDPGVAHIGVIRNIIFDNKKCSAPLYVILHRRSI